jgi:drug/metabolite transporter (DMT)-like permease
MVRSLEWRVALAFASIYVIWGSTYLAIRVLVEEVPPLLAAGLRFFIAGLLLYAAMRIRGRVAPTRREWWNLATLGLLMFVLSYGSLFWAEQFLPSGFTSVLWATIPFITVAFEVLILREHRLSARLLIPMTAGFGGVLFLLLGNAQPVPWLPCLAILGAGATWSLGAVLTRSLRLPASKGITAAGEMMLGGGVLLGLAAMHGETHAFPRVSGKAVAAMLYLVIAGSLIGFSAFVYLLSRMPAARVASHAYVNPVVAVGLGYFLAGETVTLHTLLGTILIVASVAFILIAKQPSQQRRLGVPHPTRFLRRVGSRMFPGEPG